AEVDHSRPLAPRERVRGEVELIEQAVPDDLSAWADCGCDALTAQRAEVDHAPCLCPRERVRGPRSGRTPTDHLPAGADRGGRADRAAEGADVYHPARLRPGERM